MALLGKTVTLKFKYYYFRITKNFLSIIYNSQEWNWLDPKLWVATDRLHSFCPLSGEEKS